MSSYRKHFAALLAGITLCLDLSPLSGNAPGLAAARADQLIQTEAYRLQNGMQVILHEDHRTPFVAMQVTYHYGPLYERAATRGLAHLFEHLLQGSSTEHLKPSSPSAHLRRIGAVQVRGRLEPDRADSWSVVPSANLESALWAESDRMGFLLPAVEKADIATSKMAIELEDRLRLSTVPYAVGDDRMSAALIPLGHPFHGNWLAIVPQASTVADLKDTFRRSYAPSNATLVLAGDFARDDAVQLINKYFATLPKSPPPAAPQLELGSIEQEVVLRHEDSVARRPRLKLGWRVPALKQPGSAVADLVTLLLERGTSGRLYQELVQRRGLALDVRATRVVTSPQTLLFITAHAEQEAALPQILQGIDTVLSNLKDVEVSAEELTAVKRHYANRQLLQLHDILQKAHLLQTYNHYLGTPDGLEQELARADAVSAAEVRKFLRDYLAPAHRVVLYSTVAQHVVVSGEKP